MMYNKYECLSLLCRWIDEWTKSETWHLFLGDFVQILWRFSPGDIYFHNHSYNSVLKDVQTLNDKSVKQQTALICPLKPSLMSEEEMEAGMFLLAEECGARGSIQCQEDGGETEGKSCEA